MGYRETIEWEAHLGKSGHGFICFDDVAVPHLQGVAFNLPYPRYNRVFLYIRYAEAMILRIFVSDFDFTAARTACSFSI